MVSERVARTLSNPLLGTQATPACAGDVVSAASRELVP